MSEHPAFLWFFEGVDRHAISTRDAGLVHQAPHGLKCVRVEQGVSPNGVAGCLARANEKGTEEFPRERWRFDLNNQTWCQYEPGKWVGYWNDWKPTPEALGRFDMPNTQFPLEIVMGDGEFWTFPQVLTRCGLVALPAWVLMAHCSAAGELIDGCERVRSWIFERQQQAQLALALGEPVEMDMADDMPDESECEQILTCALRLSYRVGLGELKALGVFEGRANGEALGSMIS